MNLKETAHFGAKMYKEYGVTIEFAEAAFRFVRDVIIEALKNGEEVDISMLGKFVLRDHNVKRLYDFSKGEVIEGGGTFKTVKFRPSEFLSTVVRENNK